MDLGRTGVWTFQLDLVPSARARELAAELEALGYGAIWLPEAVGRDALVASTLALGATARVTVATGVVPVTSRTAMTTNAAWRTIEEAFPGRFVLGLGVSHRPAVEGLHGAGYGRPLETMRAYLDRMDASLFLAHGPATTPARVLAALGPRMLALAAERTDGALTYNVPPEHTHAARGVLGDAGVLAVEQKVVLGADADTARRVARAALQVYTELPNYVNNWRRLGFTDDDFTNGASDRLVDALVVWGDEDAVRARVQAHLDAGADHVCVQALSPEGVTGLPLDAWRRLAPALTA
ncbi:MAG: LLM class F420-dependent oxidoreductase [Acidimicrobiia bacterium]|nr:MAG: LLM class F420-dependent oxidoreductase [Acidimicrobiia bacterium]